MPQLRIALAQVNPTVGDFGGNTELILASTRQAVAAGAHLVAFPEMVLPGYPIEDLALRWSFQKASITALDLLAPRLSAEGLGDIAVVVGYLDLRDGGRDHPVGTPRGAPINAAAVLHGGSVIARYAKHHLPNYGVFDEFRYFVRGTQPCVVRLHGADIALGICEDLWQEGGPVAQVHGVGAGLLVVINGSPYELHKDDTRLDLVSRRAREAGAALAYVNLVGGQDELVFDGDSLVVDEDGELVARAPQFQEDLLVVDLDLPTGRGYATAVISTDPVPAYEPAPAPISARIEDEAEVYHALVLGLRDYVAKNGFSSVVFGFSGGIDSALVAAIAADAIGGQNVHGLSLPSRYSSQHSQDDADELGRRTGAHVRRIPIGPMFDAFMSAMELTGLAEENLQARIRGTAVMAISNQEGHLVLAPGNKSELSVGYSTIYGDAVGGFGPIKDVPKTLVFRLARWRNAEAERLGQTPPIPPNSISKPPSAELRPGQRDTDSLPEYDVLDELLDAYVEGDRGAAELVADGYDRSLVERVLRMTDFAEYKRRQYPIGTKITPRSFGRDRRQPITNRFRETAR